MQPRAYPHLVPPPRARAARTPDSSTSPPSPASAPATPERPAVGTDDDASRGMKRANDAVSSARRQRRKPRLFDIEAPLLQRKLGVAAVVVNGRGLKLSSLPNFVYAFDRLRARDPEVEFLHRLLFGCAGQAFRRKTSVRAFSGFVFATDKERARVNDKLKRAHVNMVRKVAVLLDLPVPFGSSKEETAHAVLQFLEEPKLLPGRPDLAERDRKEKRLRMEKIKRKAQKAREHKDALMRKAAAAKRKQQESDEEDGDEDLEYTAKTWIVMAQEKAELERQSTQPSEADLSAPSDEEEILDEGSNW